eukprot:8017848-Alexandrium_andersonii.AAC.1
MIAREVPPQKRTGFLIAPFKMCTLSSQRGLPVAVRVKCTVGLLDAGYGDAPEYTSCSELHEWV